MKRLLPFIVLLILLIGGIIAVPIFLNPERRRAEITDSLSKIFKRPVVVGQLSMGYFPPTLKLGQVAIMKEAGNPLLEIASISAPLDWASLFKATFVPAELEFKQWSLMILRKPDGRWDLQDWLSGMSEPTGAQGAPMRQVRWKEGQIHWVDRYGSASQELVLGSLSGSWDSKAGTLATEGVFSGLSSTAQLSLRAKGKFFSSPQWTGDLQLSDRGNAAVFHVDDKADGFEVKGQSVKWGLANAVAFLKFYGRSSATSADSLSMLALENWQFHILGSAGRLSFEHRAGLAGGLCEAKGSVEQKPTGLLLHVDGAAKDIPAAAVWSLVGQTIPLSGQVTAVATNVELLISTQTAGSFNGLGYWELQEGVYQVPASSVNKLAKAKTMAYMKKKFPDFETKGFPVAKLSGHWQAKDGIVTVEDGLFVSTDLKAGWTGRFDALHQGLEGFLCLQIREKDSQTRRLIPTQYQNQPAYGRFQGTWQEWTLRAIRSTKIPSGVQAKLRKAVNQK